MKELTDIRDKFYIVKQFKFYKEFNLIHKKGATNLGKCMSASKLKSKKLMKNTTIIVLTN